MTKIENGTIRQLPDKMGKIFESCYQSSSYIFVSTSDYLTTVIDRLVYLLDFEGLSWLKPLRQRVFLFLVSQEKLKHKCCKQKI